MYLERVGEIVGGATVGADLAALLHDMKRRQVVAYNPNYKIRQPCVLKNLNALRKNSFKCARPRLAECPP